MGAVLMDPRLACDEIQKILNTVERPDPVVDAIRTIAAALEQYRPAAEECEIPNPDIAADVERILDIVGRDPEADCSPYCEDMGGCSYHRGTCGYYADIGE